MHTHMGARTQKHDEDTLNWEPGHQRLHGHTLTVPREHADRRRKVAPCHLHNEPQIFRARVPALQGTRPAGD